MTIWIPVDLALLAPARAVPLGDGFGTHAMLILGVASVLAAAGGILLERHVRRRRRGGSARMGREAERRVYRWLRRRGWARWLTRGAIDVETRSLLLQVRSRAVDAAGCFAPPRMSEAEQRDLVRLAERRGMRAVLAMVAGVDRVAFWDLGREAWIDPRDLRRTYVEPRVYRLAP